MLSSAANSAVLGLEDGECVLTDGSSPSDWCLPTKEEWEVTVERTAAEMTKYKVVAWLYRVYLPLVKK